MPYVWGGAGPETFDCSGLTMRAWERAGVELPHFAADQYARSRPLDYSQLRPGDLVFWSHDGTPQDIYHVALYLGDDRIIEAPRTGAVVKVASLWIMGVPSYYGRP
ncbi:C40 family peptidase [Streptacidiphilus sp. 4-A2]|nr:C40 family peptidase [Streptacidiphilus sp. 4-A2]